MKINVKKGDVLELPGTFLIRGKRRRGKGIVMQATTKRWLLCSYNPNEHPKKEPHVGYYKASLHVKKVGHVKKMPKGCLATWKWKQRFFAEHPYFKENPHPLDGAKRRKRR